jgi:histidinol dehydrogenase
MTAVTARAAGVSQVWVASPRPTQVTLAAAAIAGADGLLAIGGVQAIGALARGLLGIPTGGCDMIVGPGNRWVTAAKQLVSGHVGIDMLAGPSELLVLADDTADPTLVAADLLAQAEHDTAAQSILITDDAALAARVELAVEAQLTTLPRADVARASWREFGAVILVPDLASAVPLVDAIAPEHLEIVADDAEGLAARIRNTGAIFLGAYTPEAIGDYVAGSNHVLPTARSARFSSGLGVLDFMKRTSILKCGPEQLARLGPAAIALGEAEGLAAHARSVAIRLNRR